MSNLQSAILNLQGGSAETVESGTVLCTPAKRRSALCAPAAVLLGRKVESHAGMKIRSQCGIAERFFILPIEEIIDPAKDFNSTRHPV